MATMTRQIAAGDNDAQETAGTVDVTGAALNANSATGYIGLIFASCSELVNATINEAHLELYCTSGSFDDPYVYIKIHDTSFRTAWVGGTNEISASSKIAGSVTWDATGIGVGWENSPDISSLIRSLTTGGTWPSVGYPSYHNIVVEIGGIDATSLLRIRAYEGDSAQAAKLVVDYTPSGLLIPRRRRQYLRF